MTTALVFGVFDGLHEGHKQFLFQALEKCDKLIVVVTLPEIVRILKNKMPSQSFEERAKALQSFNPRIETVAGDAVRGSWHVLNVCKPDIILLGYDQQGIAEELARKHIRFEFLSAHQPEKYKSSLLR